MRVLIVIILFLSSCSSLLKSGDDYSRTPSSSFNCNDAVSLLFQKSNSNIPNAEVTPEEAETIKSYIFQGPILNYYLRTKDDHNQEIILQSMLAANNLDEVKANEIILKLDDLLIRHSNNREKRFLFRGESRPNDGTIKKGAKLKYKNYISTTRNKDLALGYANGNADSSDLKIVYEIEILPGQTGLQINEIAPKGIRNQDEFLLPRGGYIHVMEVTEIDGITFVKASFLDDNNN